MDKQSYSSRILVLCCNQFLSKEMCGASAHRAHEWCMTVCNISQFPFNFKQLSPRQDHNVKKTQRREQLLPANSVLWTPAPDKRPTMAIIVSFCAAGARVENCSSARLLLQSRRRRRRSAEHLFAPIVRWQELIKLDGDRTEEKHHQG